MSHLGKKLPLWVLPSVLLTAALIVGALVWKMGFAATPRPGPSIPVHAGMYDLRQEMRKAMSAKGTGSERSTAMASPGDHARS